MDQLIISGEGFPGTNELLQFLADAHGKPTEALVGAFGNNAILSGMYGFTGINDPTPNVSNGWLVYGNELLPFIGGVVSSTVAIIEEVTEAGYDTNGTGDFSTVQPVWKKRYCRFGTMATPGAVSTFPYSILKRVESNRSLMSKTRFLKTGTAQIHSNTFHDLTAGTKWTTGDFIGIVRELNTFTNYELIYTITFNQPMIEDYFPLIKLRGGAGNVVSADEVTIIDRSAGSMTIGFIPAHWVGPNDLFSAEMEIYLIGA